MVWGYLRPGLYLPGKVLFIWVGHNVTAWHRSIFDGLELTNM